MLRWAYYIREARIGWHVLTFRHLILRSRYISSLYHVAGIDKIDEYMEIRQ